VDYLGSTRLVTTTGGTVLQQVDYTPYGRKTGNELLNSGESDYLWGGKELQEFIDIPWYDSGARFLTTDGVFTSIDPLCEKAYHISPNAYCDGNPVNLVDPEGRDAIPIVFPDYRINVRGVPIPLLGHAGILLIDNKSGLTKYYEYGRYDPDKYGVVRNLTISNVTIGKDGHPTQRSLKRVLKEISRQAGHGGRIEGVYIESDKFAEMNNYALERMKENQNPDRDKYNTFTRNCSTFVSDVLNQDEDVRSISENKRAARPRKFIKNMHSIFKRVVQYKNDEFIEKIEK